MLLAARGQRDMDTGREAIADAEERAVVRRQARRVHLQTIVAAVVATGLVYVLLML